MNAAEILDKAADYIDTHGWYQGDLSDGGSRVCAVGALRRVETSKDCVYAAHEALGSVIYSKRYWAVAQWNDDPERTKDEVTSTMRAVAATLRAAATESVLPVQRNVEVDAESAALIE